MEIQLEARVTKLEQEVTSLLAALGPDPCPGCGQRGTLREVPVDPYGLAGLACDHCRWTSYDDPTWLQRDRAREELEALKLEYLTLQQHSAELREQRDLAHRKLARRELTDAPGS